MNKPFDPESTLSAADGIFGLPCTQDEAALVLIPVPWEVTTSYGSGASQGPQAIRNASPQLDLYDLRFGRPYEAGIYMQDMDHEIEDKNEQLKALAEQVKSQQEKGALDEFGHEALQRVNDGSRWLTDQVQKKCEVAIQQGQKVGVVGGDHSSPLGLIECLGQQCQGQYGVLHIDAHADLRLAYQGFEQSHASIMRNVMQSRFAPQCLVQVGIRDFCEDEKTFIDSRPDIQTFFDRDLKKQMFEGQTWSALCATIIAPLPQKVYVSFDIDGLSPEFCPHTGTPVPGGLNFDQAIFLLEQIITSGREVIGFDLCEVAPGPDAGDEYDANVGARILYQLCAIALANSPIR